MTSEAPAGTEARGRFEADLALAAALTAMCLMPFAVTGANLAFPDIEADFDTTSRATLSWALTGYSIVVAAFSLLGGQSSDRFDARRVFLGGLGAFAAASLVAGLAPNAGWLIAGRSLQGIGAAFVVPASLLIATTFSPPERRPFVIGVWTAAFPIGSAVAPSLAAVLLEAGSWRWVFLTPVLVAAISAALALPLRTRDEAQAQKPEAGGPPDLLGIVVGTAAVGLATLGIGQGPTWGWGSGRTLGSVLVAAVLLVAFVWRSLGHPRPMMDLTLYRTRSYAVASAASVFIAIAGTSVWLLWPLFMQNEWGYSAIDVGLAITPTPAIAGAVSILAAKRAATHGYRNLLIVGSVLLLLANAFFATALGGEPDYLGTMLPGLVLYGFAMGLTFAPVNAAALLDVPVSKYGQANAAFSAARAVSGAIGVAAVIAALGSGGSTDPIAPFSRAFTLLAVVSAAGLLLVAAAFPRQSVTDH